MEMVNVILTLIAVFLGLFAGAGLANIAPEELKIGSKYCKLLYYFLLAAGALVSIIVLSQQGLPAFGALLVISGIFVFIKFNDHFDVFAYSVAILMLLISKGDVFFLMAIATFLVGFPLGTILVSKRASNFWSNSVAVANRYGLIISAGIIIRLFGW